MKRIYYPYTEWEDYQNGLFKTVSSPYEGVLINNAISLLSNPKKFYEVAKKVINEWPKAADLNLSNVGRNRQAWIGQASCCYKFGVPENQTKRAWNLLTEQQQNDANKIADIIILEWEKSKEVGK